MACGVRSWETCGPTVRKSGWYMSADVFSTSTPKPRAEGSSPSAPAKKARNHAGSGLFLFAFYQLFGGFLSFFYQPSCTVG